jgi:hypothetical protein
MIYELLQESAAERIPLMSPRIENEDLRVRGSQTLTKDLDHGRLSASPWPSYPNRYSARFGRDQSRNCIGDGSMSKCVIKRGFVCEKDSGTLRRLLRHIGANTSAIRKWLDFS